MGLETVFNLQGWEGKLATGIVCNFALHVLLDTNSLGSCTLEDKEALYVNVNYDITIGLWFSLIASFMIIGSAFVAGIVMYKETKKLK